MHLTIPGKLLIYRLLSLFFVGALVYFICIGLNKARDIVLPEALRDGLFYGLAFGFAGAGLFGLALGLLLLVNNRWVGGWLGWLSYISFIIFCVISWGGIIPVGIFFGAYAALTYSLVFSLFCGLIWSMYKIFKLQEELT